MRRNLQQILIPAASHANAYGRWKNWHSKGTSSWRLRAILQLSGLQPLILHVDYTQPRLYVVRMNMFSHKNIFNRIGRTVFAVSARLHKTILRTPTYQLDGDIVVPNPAGVAAAVVVDSGQGPRRCAAEKQKVQSTSSCQEVRRSALHHLVQTHGTHSHSSLFGVQRGCFALPKQDKGKSRM